MLSRRKVGTPSYAKQLKITLQCQVTVKLPGSFCPDKSRPHLHSHFNFAGSAFKTVACSLSLSYGSELTRQRTSLPSNSYSYCCRSLELTPQAWSKCRPHLECLTYQHWAGFSPYTSPYGLAETCVFVKQSASDLSLRPCTVWSRAGHLPKLRPANLPSSLKTVLPLALVFSTHLPVSVYGTDSINSGYDAFLGD